MSGILDPAAFVDMAQRYRERTAPLGAIPGISPLLDRRRHTCGIIDDAFKLQAAFDVCFIHQIRWHEKETFGDTRIIMPQQSQQKEHEQTPRGVLVSAGASAMDCLRSNGIEPGHIVSFIRQAPWRMPIAMLGGREIYLMILRAGDITGSEDLRAAIAAGECKLEWDPEHMQHFYVDQQGQRWTPKLPFIPADY